MIADAFGGCLIWECPVDDVAHFSHIFRLNCSHNSAWFAVKRTWFVLMWFSLSCLKIVRVSVVLVVVVS